MLYNVTYFKFYIFYNIRILSVFILIVYYFSNFLCYLIYSLKYMIYKNYFNCRKKLFQKLFLYYIRFLALLFIDMLLISYLIHLNPLMIKIILIIKNIFFKFSFFYNINILLLLIFNIFLFFQFLC